MYFEKKKINEKSEIWPRLNLDEKDGVEWQQPWKFCLSFLCEDNPCHTFGRPSKLRTKWMTALHFYEKQNSDLIRNKKREREKGCHLRFGICIIASATATFCSIINACYGFLIFFMVQPNHLSWLHPLAAKNSQKNKTIIYYILAVFHY